MKTCNKCGLPPPEAKFLKAKKNKDGLSNTCNECLNKMRRARTSRKGKKEAHRRLVSTRTEKECKGCKLTLPIEAFGKHLRTIDGKRGTCRSCVNKLHREKFGPKNKELRDIEKLRIMSTIGGSCRDCGLSPSDEWPLACFDFHHEGDKNFEISHSIRGYQASNGHVMEEIKNCVILCSNCHKRHHSRLRVSKMG